MRSRLAEGGALAMRLSLVFSNAARRGAAFFVIVEAKTKFSLPSPNGSVDQRKSPSCYTRIGACGPRVRLIAFAQAGSVQPRLSDVPRIRIRLISRLKKPRGRSIKPARPGLCCGQ